MSSSSSSSASDSESSSSVASRAQKRKRAPSVSSDSSNGSSSSDDSSAASSSSDSDTDAEEVEDVPVLSHAELRRQRKKEKAEAKAKNGKGEKEDSGKKTKKVKNTAELPPSKVPKRQNSVWVGNLAFKTTPDAIRRFFEGVGEITRVHMPMKIASARGAGAVKENRGFAYVDFATPDAKTLAITLSENPLDGRKLLIKDGDDFVGRPATESARGSTQPNLTGHTKTAQKILSNQKQPAGPTLFLGNLGFEATEESIRGLFTRNRVKSRAKPKDDSDAEEDAEDAKGKGKEQDAWIRKIRMGTFEDSGKCKGWAFVDFTTTEHATAALTNPKNHFLDGRKLAVEYASPDAVRRGQGAKAAGARDRPARRDAPFRRRREDAGDAGQGEAEGQDEEAPQHEKRMRVRPKRDAPPHAQSDEPAAKRTRTDGDSFERRKPRERMDSRVRAKPGAALANARRETVGIVPSQGKKIVF